MRPTEFTDEQIIKAGLEIESQGRRVSGFAIRKLLGGGTQSRFKAVWEAYKAKGAVETPVDNRDLPVEIEDLLGQLGGTLIEHLQSLALNINNQAHRISERRVAEVLQRSAAERTQHAEEIQEASDALDDLDKEVESLKAQLKDWQQRAEVAQEASTRLSADLAASTERQRSLTAELAETKPRLAELTQTNKTLEAELVSLRPLKEEVARLRESTSAQANELAEMRAENTAGARREQTLQAQIDTQSARIRELETAGRDSEIELALLRPLKEQLAQLKLSHDALANLVAERKTELATRDEKIKGLEREVLQQHERREENQREMNRQVKALQDEIKTYQKLLDKLSPQTKGDSKKD
ncbi:chromosome segregation protein SMC [Pseudomonas aeruginosa]|nr:DNA-binding protein [Pseudomonas aeruginosa]CRN65372.1 chromosome segregation protein SMC [Pseudomonas aeruginosa]